MTMLTGQLQGTLNSPLGKPPIKASKPAAPSVRPAAPVAPSAPPPVVPVAPPSGPPAPVPSLVDSKSYDVATDESCASVAFVWDGGTREVGLPYVHFTSWNRADMEVTFSFGDIEARLKFEADFPLATLLMNFRFQRVATIYEIPGKVKMSVVKIDPETGAASPL